MGEGASGRGRQERTQREREREGKCERHDGLKWNSGLPGSATSFAHSVGYYVIYWVRGNWREAGVHAYSPVGVPMPATCAGVISALWYWLLSGLSVKASGPRISPVTHRHVGLGWARWLSIGVGLRFLFLSFLSSPRTPAWGICAFRLLASRTASSVPGLPSCSSPAFFMGWPSLPWLCPCSSAPCHIGRLFNPLALRGPLSGSPFASVGCRGFAGRCPVWHAALPPCCAAPLAALHPVSEGGPGPLCHASPPAVPTGSPSFFVIFFSTSCAALCCISFFYCIRCGTVLLSTSLSADFPGFCGAFALIIFSALVHPLPVCYGRGVCTPLPFSPGVSASLCSLGACLYCYPAWSSLWSFPAGLPVTFLRLS